MALVSDLEARSQDMVLSVRKELAMRLAPDAPRRARSLMAANILFFDKGVHPSAKTVLECTQRGSLTDINRDVMEFWREMRERSRIQLKSPAMPQGLVNAFGEALSQMWTLASTEASQVFEESRLLAQVQVEAAQDEARQAHQRADLANQRTAEIGEELRQERLQREDAEMKLGLQGAEVLSLKDTVAALQARIEQEVKARLESETRFTQELESSRHERLREAERFKGEIAFAKQQIEAARMSEKTAREQFAATKSGMEVELTQYRTRLGKADASLAQAMAELGEEKGLNKALAKSVEDLRERVRFLTTQAAKRTVSSKAPLQRRSLRRLS